MLRELTTPPSLTTGFSFWRRPELRGREEALIKPHCSEFDMKMDILITDWDLCLLSITINFITKSFPLEAGELTSWSRFIWMMGNRNKVTLGFYPMSSACSV